jgi:hypothetical protein
VVGTEERRRIERDVERACASWGFVFWKLDGIGAGAIE